MTIYNTPDFDTVTQSCPDLADQTNFNDVCFQVNSSDRLLKHINAAQKPIVFRHCVFSNLTWKEQTISEKLSFINCLFKGGDTSFKGSIFKDDVSFDESVFEGNTNFDDTCFCKNASFKNIHTVGNENTAFFFRGINMPKVEKTTWENDMDFSCSVFENQAVFNNRQFDKCTLFNKVDFQNYFYFVDTILGAKFFCDNVKYSCLENLNTKPMLESSKLYCCFENLSKSLKAAGKDIDVGIINDIMQKLRSLDTPQIRKPQDDEYVSVDVILRELGCQRQTLISYANRYSYYFRKQGTGRARRYEWKYILEFKNDDAATKRSHLKHPSTKAKHANKP